MVRRLLVIRGGALGDFVVTVPALRALRQTFADAQLTFVGNAAAASALAPELFDDIVAFDDPAVLPVFGGLAADSCQIAGTDLVVLWMNDPDGSVRSALIKLGAREILHARPIPDDPDCHIADHLLRSIRPLAPNVECEFHRRAWLDSGIVSPIDPDVAGGIIVHPGSGSPAKNWPNRRFVEIIDVLANQGFRQVVVLRGPADHVSADLVVQSTTLPVFTWQPATLSDLAAQVARARLFIGNDSGVSHVAGAVGAPSVVIFGPTNPRRWAPRGPRVSIVAPVNPGSMEAVGPTAGEVLIACEKLLRPLTDP